MNDGDSRKKASTVFTDEFSGYDRLKKHGYMHHRIQHSAKVYVSGNIHTNSIEGFWSLVKNSIRGIYHAVGQRYLQTYLNEYSFRYNRRFDVNPRFTSFLEHIEKKEVSVKPSSESLQIHPW